MRMSQYRSARLLRGLPDGVPTPILQLALLLDRLQPPETAVLISLAVLVGIGAGLGTVVFVWLIGFFKGLFFEGGSQVLGFLGRPYVIVLPILGGLLVGPIVTYWASEAKGHGVPEVMQAIALRGGRIRPRVVAVKALASALCIGSGGSVGREGPIVQIGSALGSTVGQVFRMSDDRIRTLVACGAAGGIAATFNAPIAGVIFALEVLLGEFTAHYFSSVVVSAVTASIISRIFLGDHPAFAVPAYTVASPWEVWIYPLLGVLAAGVAWLYVSILYRLEDLFDRWRFPTPWKPAVGGILMGLIGFVFPQVFGTGAETVEQALRGELALELLAVLVLAKILATAVTLGSGNSGGIFMPALFIGAMLGGVFGNIIHGILPAHTAPPGAYALVGMSSLFAAAAHAPISSVLIVFEMSGDYHLILPLMLATVHATLVSQFLRRESIYTLKLVRRGIHLERGRDIDVMQAVTVAEVMTTPVDTVPASLPLRTLAEEFSRTHHHGFPVLDDQGELYGVVTLQDLDRAIDQGGLEGLLVRDIATQAVVTVYPDETMWSALRKMAPRGLSRLPVVDRANPKKLLGLLRRSDLVKAYNVGIMRRLDLEHRTERLRVGQVSGTEFVEVVVPAGSPTAGCMLKDLALPPDCLILSVRRDHRLIIPDGNTLLESGDRLTAFVRLGQTEALRKCVNEGTRGDSQEER